jgi:hypothetical protein
MTLSTGLCNLTSEFLGIMFGVTDWFLQEILLAHNVELCSTFTFNNTHYSKYSGPCHLRPPLLPVKSGLISRGRNKQ